LYSPELVAQTILSAAQRPIREVTVGGVGQLQILVAIHFPGLFARLGGGATPMLYDRNRPDDDVDNLFTPLAGGETRSRREGGGRRFSLYTTLAIHPLLGAASLFAAVAAAASLLSARSGRRD
jgi:hypothetical protein